MFLSLCLAHLFLRERLTDHSSSNIERQFAMPIGFRCTCVVLLIASFPRIMLKNK